MEERRRKGEDKVYERGEDKDGETGWESRGWIDGRMEEEGERSVA